jgi:hypothetical protein
LDTSPLGGLVQFGRSEWGGERGGREGDIFCLLVELFAIETEFSLVSNTLSLLKLKRRGGVRMGIS